MIFVCVGATKVVFIVLAICSEVEVDFLRFLEESGIFYSDSNVLLLTMRLWVLFRG